MNSQSDPGQGNQGNIDSAVQFLTNAKVLTAPDTTKRSFLERKGLTAAEIDEAFTRASQQAPAAASLSTSSVQQPSQSQQATGLVTYQPHPNAHASTSAMAVAPATLQRHEPMRWSQIVLGIGVVAAGVYVVQSFLLPRLTEAYSSWTLASEVKRRAELDSERALIKEAVMEAVKEAVKTSREDDTCRKLAQEIRELSLSVSKLSQQAKTPSTASKVYPEPINGMGGGGGGWATSSVRNHAKTDYGQSVSPPPNGGWLSPPSGNAQSGGYDAYPSYPSEGDGDDGGGGFSAYAKGLYPNYPNPVPSSQLSPLAASSGTSSWVPPPLPSPSLSPGTLSFPSPSPPTTTSLSSVAPVPTNASPLNDVERPKTVDEVSMEAPVPGPVYPTSFHQVMDMVSRGGKPANVRSDINDDPPEPSRPPSEGR